jgi:DNA-binding MarR family transcriptional regulator
MSTVKPKISHAEYVVAATLRAALRRFENQSARVLREHGLTRERYELLLAIRARTQEHRQATIAELADELQLAQSSMTQLARRAENAGLLHRRVSRQDARVRYLALTEAAAEKLAAAASALGPERQHLITLLGSFDTADREALPAQASA